MPKDITYTTVASADARPQATITIYDDNPDDDTLAKKIRVQMTGTIVGSDGSSRRQTVTFRGTPTVPSDGDADGSGIDKPAARVGSSDAAWTNLRASLVEIYGKDYRAITTNDGE